MYITRGDYAPADAHTPLATSIDLEEKSRKILSQEMLKFELWGYTATMFRGKYYQDFA